MFPSFETRACGALLRMTAELLLVWHKMIDEIAVAMGFAALNPSYRRY